MESTHKLFWTTTIQKLRVNGRRYGNRRRELATYYSYLADLLAKMRSDFREPLKNFPNHSPWG
jgi:hypothetical protein